MRARAEGRKVVKQIVGGVTALAAYHVLPVKWEKPIIEQVFLPAHAQTSGVVEGEIVEHSHPHTHDEDHPETHVDSHSHADPHPATDTHTHSHDLATTNHGVATISFLKVVEEANNTNTWEVSYVRTVTNGPVELTFKLENLTGGFELGKPFTEIVSDGSSFSGIFFVPIALLPRGDTLRLKATSSDPAVIITGSPLDFTTPAP